MKIRISEKMILDWLDWDGFKYSIVPIEMKKGTENKIVPATDLLGNEFRLTSMVEFLNSEIAKQIDTRETSHEKEAQPQTLGVNVAERIKLSESVGPEGRPQASVLPRTFEANAVGLLFIDPVTGEVKSGKCSFLTPDKASVPLEKGKKLLVEVK